MSKQLVFDTTDVQSLAASDNVGARVRAGDDGALIGHVSDALKVNFSNTTIAVTATNLDIRDLVFASDKVDVSGSTVALDSTTLAALESITVQNGAGASAVNIQDGGNSITVDASDLDIRNLDYTLDNVAIKGATGNQLVINADGSINVNADISVVTGHEKTEDAAHSSGDIGSYVLAVRQDTLAVSTSADGDYASFKVDAVGALYVNLTNSISVNDAALANTAILSSSKTLAVADTAEAVKTSALASRKYMWIMNYDKYMGFIGGAGVTEANGFPIIPKAMIELRAGPSVSPFFVFESGKVGNFRALELS